MTVQAPETHDELLALAEEDGQQQKVSKCKYCGKGGLQWLTYGGGNGFKPKWILVELENNRLTRHKCAQAAAAFSKGK